MNTSVRLLPRLACLLCLVLASGGTPLLAQETRRTNRPVADRTRVLDAERIDKIQQALVAAKHNGARLIQSNAIPARIQGVRAVLDEDEVDLARLDAALQALRDEMDRFTGNFEEAVDPLWAVQEQIDETVSRARLLAARAGSRDPSPAIQQRLRGYDRRLHELAVQIRKERDPTRRQRHRVSFANMVRFREITENFSKVDLGPANREIYVKLIEGLTHLQDGSTAFLFTLDHTRMVLKETSGLLGDYQFMVRNLHDIQKLGGIVDEFHEGLGMTGDAEDFDTLLEPLNDLTGALEGILLDAVRNIETNTPALRPIPGSDLGPALEKQIDHYHDNPPPATSR